MRLIDMKLPEIFPADPRAPEPMRHRRQPLRYGFPARFFFNARTN